MRKLITYFFILLAFGCNKKDQNTDINQINTAPQAITGSVNYLSENFIPKSSFNPLNTDNFQSADVKITPISEASFVPSLSKNGFTTADFRSPNDNAVLALLGDLESAVKEDKSVSPDDVRAATSNRIEEFEKHIKKWAKTHLPQDSFTDVVCGAGIYRNTKLSVLSNRPFEFIHADYYDMNQDLKELFEASGFEQDLKRKFGDSTYKADFWQKHKLATMLNFWMPLATVQAYPLALLDIQTLSPADRVAYKAQPIGAAKAFLGVGVKFNKNHKFYYRPNLERGEALVFETPKTPHTAFKLPDQKGDRQSFDIRCAFIKAQTSSQTTNTKNTQVDAVKYYETWAGHEVALLKKVYDGLKLSGCTNFIFYAGDSSLDNKAWLFKARGKKQSDASAFQDDNITAPAINGYERILVPPRMVKDVDYWVNKLLADGRGPKNQKICSIMTSVEATTLADRDASLLDQDKFLRDHLTENDYLVVSVGGNDAAFRSDPTVENAIATLKTKPNDPVALGVLLSIVGPKTQKYIEKLVEKKKPQNTLVSMIYYPDEKEGESWAGASAVLDAFGYSDNPKKLQDLNDFLYKEGTAKIRIAGAKVTPVKLSEVLDGKTSSDYFERVEPSVEGGRKMAEFFIEKLFK